MEFELNLRRYAETMVVEMWRTAGLLENFRRTRLEWIREMDIPRQHLHHRNQENIDNGEGASDPEDVDDEDLIRDVELPFRQMLEELLQGYYVNMMALNTDNARDYHVIGSTYLEQAYSPMAIKLAMSEQNLNTTKRFVQSLRAPQLHLVMGNGVHVVDALANLYPLQRLDIEGFERITIWDILNGVRTTGLSCNSPNDFHGDHLRFLVEREEMPIDLFRATRFLVEEQFSLRDLLLLVGEQPEQNGRTLIHRRHHVIEIHQEENFLVVLCFPRLQVQNLTPLSTSVGEERAKKESDEKTGKAASTNPTDPSTKGEQGDEVLDTFDDVVDNLNENEVAAKIGMKNTLLSKLMETEKASFSEATSTQASYLLDDKVINQLLSDVATDRAAQRVTRQTASQVRQDRRVLVEPRKDIFYQALQSGFKAEKAVNEANERVVAQRRSQRDGVKTEVVQQEQKKEERSAKEQKLFDLAYESSEKMLFHDVFAEGSAGKVINPDPTFPSLLKTKKRLGIWDKLEATETNSLGFWTEWDMRTARITNQSMGPENAFEEQIEWTLKGKQWPYPINNEYLLGSEDNVSFVEHIFLERNLKKLGIPKTGPVAHFMHLPTDPSTKGEQGGEVLDTFDDVVDNLNENEVAAKIGMKNTLLSKLMETEKASFSEATSTQASYLLDDKVINQLLSDVATDRAAQRVTRQTASQVRQDRRVLVELRKDIFYQALQSGFKAEKAVNEANERVVAQRRSQRDGVKTEVVQQEQKKEERSAKEQKLFDLAYESSEKMLFHDVFAEGSAGKVINPDPTFPSLLKTKKRLGIWDKLEATETNSLGFWTEWDMRTARITNQSMGPENAFEEQIEWTLKGKQWPYPINNEYLLGSEDNVSFVEHIFLERNLKKLGIPKTGPVAHFMHLVTVGLSKSPFMTADKKMEHLDLFANYVKAEKQKLVHKLHEDELVAAQNV